MRRPMRLSVQETSHSPTYAPFYVASARGFFEEEGLQVEMRPMPGPGQAAKRILLGEVDICLGGIMRVLKERDTDPGNRLVGFCEIVSRDPLFLVAMEERPGFRLADLRELRLRPFTETPTGWLCLKADLARLGVDAAELTVEFAPVGENIEALLLGAADIVQLSEPHLEAAVDRGAKVVYPLGRRGPEAHSCCYALPQTLAERRPELLAFTAAVHRGQRAVAESSAAEIAKIIAGAFDSEPVELLRRGFERYKDIGLWAKTPFIDERGYEVIQSSLVMGGFVSSRFPFEETVDNSVAEAVLRTPSALADT